MRAHGGEHQLGDIHIFVLGKKSPVKCQQYAHLTSSFARVPAGPTVALPASNIFEYYLWSLHLFHFFFLDTNQCSMQILVGWM